METQELKDNINYLIEEFESGHLNSYELVKQIKEKTQK
jgi:hypothetical protein